METAAAIGRATGLTPVAIEALDEIDFGTWTGRRFDALEGDPHWDEWNSARASARPPGGESMDEAAGRIAGHAARLAAEHAEARIALVSHCDMIRALVARCLGLTLDNLLRFEIAPASVSRIEVAPWGARVVSLNEVGWSPMAA
jgi:ribonuclease H / adenosylcobalamin/alpha-ribazole phosphatase